MHTAPQVDKGLETEVGAKNASAEIRLANQDCQVEKC
jgi:hypothetical protein